MYNRKSSIGMTLIEMMLALMLSLFVISALVEIYYVTENNYAAQSALLQLQQNARIANEILSSKVRMAGFMGCAHLTSKFPLINHTQINLSQRNKIAYFQAAEMKPGTDGFAIWQAKSISGLLTNNMSDYSTIPISKEIPVSAGDVLFISDCKTTELFTVKASQNKNGEQIVSTSTPLNKLYAQSAEIIPLEMEAYFIADTGRLNENHQPIYALYRKGLDQQKIELAEGVDQMQIDYVLVDGKKTATHHWNSTVDSENMLALSLQLTLSTLTKFILQKNWYIYVALREI